jgi:hypothetical protein
MSDLYIAFGSWKLRHNEPISADEQRLTLLPVVQPCDPAAQSILLRLDSAFDRRAGFDLSPSGEQTRLAAVADSQDTSIPLAVVARHELGFAFTHALFLLDREQAQLVRLPATYHVQTDAPLWRQIYDFNESQHVFFSNHECYYIKSRETTELEQKFNFTTVYSYLQVIRELFAALDSGDFQGFRPKYTQEIQCWSYDNYFYDILPNASGDQGYVSMIHYCKKKDRWDDPMYMYKKKVYSQDSLERWERNYRNQRVDRDKQTMLEEFFGYPLQVLPTWRRSRCDIGVESVENGNIFMINVDDCQIHGMHPPDGRLQQCEIEYLMTRGVPDQASIYRDFWGLVEHVSAFLAQLGLEPIKTNYSKLTWLRDVVADSR